MIIKSLRIFDAELLCTFVQSAPWRGSNQTAKINYTSVILQFVVFVSGASTLWKTLWVTFRS